MRIELDGSKIKINENVCCDIKLSKKEIKVEGKFPYNVIIKLGYNGYRIIQDNIEVGRGKGFNVIYKGNSVKPNVSKEQVSLNLINGKEINFIDSNNMIIGKLKFDNGKLIEDFDADYAIFGIIYMSYLFGVMNKTINAYRSGEGLNKPLVSLRISSSYIKISLLIFVLLLISIVFISSFSVLLAYIISLFLLLVPIIARAASANEYINFYDDHLEIYKRPSYNKTIIFYSDVKEIKPRKRGFIMSLNKRILNKDLIYIPYDPKIEGNKNLSNFIQEKISN